MKLLSQLTVRKLDFFCVKLKLSLKKQVVELETDISQNKQLIKKKITANQNKTLQLAVSSPSFLLAVFSGQKIHILRVLYTITFHGKKKKKNL